MYQSVIFLHYNPSFEGASDHHVGRMEKPEIAMHWKIKTRVCGPGHAGGDMLRGCKEQSKKKKKKIKGREKNPMSCRDLDRKMYYLSMRSSRRVFPKTHGSFLRMYNGT